MTYEELLAKLLISDEINIYETLRIFQAALYAVVELHKPKINGDCPKCVFMIDPMGKSEMYPHPCPTIQAIEKELI